MEILKEFEKKVIYFLLSDSFSPDQLHDLVENCNLVGYEFTGVGYFLSIGHTLLSNQRATLDKPITIGEIGDTTTGFIIFIEKNELTIECYTWIGSHISENFRNENVRVRQVTIESGKFVSII